MWLILFDHGRVENMVVKGENVAYQHFAEIFSRANFLKDIKCGKE